MKPYHHGYLDQIQSHQDGSDQLTFGNHKLFACKLLAYVGHLVVVNIIICRRDVDELRIKNVNLPEKHSQQ